VLLLLDWQKVMLFIGLPLTFGNLFTVLTNLLHHDGAVAGAGHDVSYSYMSPLENLLFLNGGYHAMHHQDPALHWSELPAAHAVRLAPRQAPGMERRSMFAQVVWGYLWSSEANFRGPPRDR
jgi:fatty acid desaturase